jgi:2Fe-2S ferredoxin
MAKITFITPEQETITLEADSGSVMALAVENGIQGIDGDCGGVCSCATCHVHVNPAHVGQTGEASEIEKDMLELDDNANEFSRLCCQIEITQDLDGVELTVASDA